MLLFSTESPFWSKYGIPTPGGTGCQEELWSFQKRQIGRKGLAIMNFVHAYSYLAVPPPSRVVGLDSDFCDSSDSSKSHHRWTWQVTLEKVTAKRWESGPQRVSLLAEGKGNKWSHGAKREKWECTYWKCLFITAEMTWLPASLWNWEGQIQQKKWNRKENL